MRILFVARSDSIHTARWINQLDGQGWDIHLFPSIDIGVVNPELRNVTVHHSFYHVQKNRHQAIKSRGVPVIFPRIAREVSTLGRIALERIWSGYRMFQLGRLIRKLKPDIIHSMEIQAAGYLVSGVRKRNHDKFPSWIVTNWGSDIYLFGRLDAHVNKIREVLAKCDYYSCECQRDVQLAKQMGLKGEVLPVLPNTGGFDLARLAQFRQPGPTSKRRMILLKGYQYWAGRALVGLRALALCADSLRGYRVGVYLANNDDVKIAAELVSQTTGLPVEVIPYCSHDDMLRWYGQARISIGLSISDAISTSLLEAMVMGAFPIQSSTACCDEWIVDGETGLIVPPEDPEPIAAAIRKAVSDDQLVDRAAELNARVAQERLDQAVIKPQVIAMYEKIAAEAANKRK
jgi:glycosyltransferase involved in cell wall biosynthesis